MTESLIDGGWLFSPGEIQTLLQEYSEVGERSIENAGWSLSQPGSRVTSQY